MTTKMLVEYIVVLVTVLKLESTRSLEYYTTIFMVEEMYKYILLVVVMGGEIMGFSPAGYMNKVSLLMDLFTGYVGMEKT